VIWVCGGAGREGGGGKRDVSIEGKIAYLKVIKKSKNQYDHNTQE
jgi:hypothetical protein